MATRAIPTPASVGFSGAEEIRTFLPEVDDAMFQRLHLPAYSAQQFHADLERVTRGRIDKQLADVLVQQSNAAIHWMRELGIKWEIDSHVVIDGGYYFEPGLVIHPVGGISGGLGQLGQWREIATRMGVEIRYESRVRELLGNDRRIEGVVVSDPNEEYEMRSGSIILCAGGFQANPEMRARYLGPNADLMKVRGSRHDTGEVLMMTLGAGREGGGPLAGRPRDAHRLDLSRRGDRQQGESLRLSLRYYCQFARPALFRRGRGAPFVHVREDGLGGAQSTRGCGVSDL